jgi:hypothetical protein
VAAVYAWHAGWPLAAWGFDPAAAVVRITVPERTLAADDRLDEVGLRTLTTQVPFQQGAVAWPMKIRPGWGADP